MLYKAYFLSFLRLCNSCLHSHTLPAFLRKVHWQSHRAVGLTLDLATGCSHAINPNSLIRLPFIFPEVAFPSVPLRLQ